MWKCWIKTYSILIWSLRICFVRDTSFFLLYQWVSSDKCFRRVIMKWALSCHFYNNQIFHNCCIPINAEDAILYNYYWYETCIVIGSPIVIGDRNRNREVRVCILATFLLLLPNKKWKKSSNLTLRTKENIFSSSDFTPKLIFFYTRGDCFLHPRWFFFYTRGDFFSTPWV